MMFTSDFHRPYRQNLLIRYGAHRLAQEQPIVAWCVEQGIDPAFMETILEAFTEPESFPKDRLMGFETTLVLDYLQRTHRYYLDKLLPEIELVLFDWIRATAGTHPIPLYLLEKFAVYRSDLETHIADEENDFFPFVQRLLVNEVQHSADELQRFIAGHEHKEEQLTAMRSLITCTQLSATDQLFHRVLLTKLELLERDLLVHALVEDEVLVAQVEALIA